MARNDPPPARRPVILKFGGESLSAPDALVEVVRRTRRGGVPVVVVTSAREGVTDLLKVACDGRGVGALGVIDELRRLHPAMPSAGGPLLENLTGLLESTRGPEPVAASTRDEILSYGERLAAHWLARILEDAEIPCRPVMADELGVVTDNSYGASRIRVDASGPAVRAGLRRIHARRQVPVVTGFFGRSQEGRTATLGRGGSDYSASAIGAMIGASRVELVKRHVAIFTADPRLVPRARPVEWLSFEEAEEFAQFGARVLHPVTIEPARTAQMEIRVRSLNDEDLVTSIGPARPGAAARTVTLLGPLRSISLRIAGGRQRPGIVGTIGSELVAAGINLVAVVTTEAVLGLLVEPADEAAAHRILAPLAGRMGASLGRPVPVSLVSAVGEGILADLPRLRSSYLEGAGGLLATPRSISLVVPEERALSSLRAFHRAFVELRAPNFLSGPIGPSLSATSRAGSLAPPD